MAGDRVAVVGFDACDKDIMMRLAQQGRAPTVARLLAEGAWSVTDNPPGLFVGSVWPTLATSVSPARHGRYCFRQFEPGTYEIRPTEVSTAVHADPFWAHAARQGSRIAVYDVPHSFVVPDIPGRQLVDWGAHDANPGYQSSPDEIRRDADAFGPHPVGIDCNGQRTTPEEFAELRERLLQGIELRTRMARDFIARDDWDLFCYVFSEGHCVGHQCWHLHDPDHPRSDPRITDAVGDVLEEVYERLDAALADVLAELGDITVIVVFSHGMGPHYGGNHLLEPVLRAIDLAERPRAERIARRARTLARTRIPAPVRRLGKRMLGRQVGDTVGGNVRPTGNRTTRISDAEWRRFHSVPNNDVHGGIRLNVRGREPQGVVDPGDVDRVCGQLTDDLLELVNIDTGRPAVRRVFRTAEIYDGPQLTRLPDLLVEWNWERPIDRVVSEKAGRIEQVDREWRTGDHRPGGLVLATGPHVRPGRIEGGFRAEDLGATACALLGVDLEVTDGRPHDAITGGRTVAPQGNSTR